MTHRIVNVRQGIEDIRAGKMIILVDDEARENEGDLCFAANHVTPQHINFMANYGRGLICLSLTEDKADRLDLAPMVLKNNSMFETAFTVSIDAARGISTGISAQDRTTTIHAAVSEHAEASDLVRPGHVFPLRSRRDGVLVRSGQTEGSVDLARLAGLAPAGVICEIMNEDGTMARMPDLIRFAETHRLNIVTIADLIRYRMSLEKRIYRLMEGESPLKSWGKARVVAYGSDLTPEDVYIALISGNLASETPVPVGVHQQCWLGAVMGSLFSETRHETHPIIQRSQRMIAKEGRGVLIHIQPRDIGAAFHRLSRGFSLTGEKNVNPGGGAEQARRRLMHQAIVSQILRDLDLQTMRWIANDLDEAFPSYQALEGIEPAEPEHRECVEPFKIAKAG